MSLILKRLAGLVKPEEIGVKYRPNFAVPDITVPAGCIILPQYLSANLLLLKSQIVISYASATLFEAADAGKKAIALLKVLKSVSQEWISEHKKYLSTNTSGEICFPETIDALISEVEKDLSCSA
jgi:hypothetical protein